MNKEAGLTHRVNMEVLDRGADDASASEEITLRVENVDLYYSEKQALKNINMTIPRNRVTAFIGPSGCGKSTLLRCFNRMNEVVSCWMMKISITKTCRSPPYVAASAWCFKNPILSQKAFMKMLPMACALSGLKINVSWMKILKKL